MEALAGGKCASLFPDKEQSCKLTRTPQVLDTAVGHLGPVFRVTLIKVASVRNREDKSLTPVDTYLLWVRPEVPPGFQSYFRKHVGCVLESPLAISSSPGLNSHKVVAGLLCGSLSGSLLWPLCELGACRKVGPKGGRKVPTDGVFLPYHLPTREASEWPPRKVPALLELLVTFHIPSC